MDEPGICFPSHWRLCTKTKVRFKGIRNLDTSRKVFSMVSVTSYKNLPKPGGGEAARPESLRCCY